MLYNIRVLHRMNGHNLFAPLVGVVVSSEQKQIKSLLIDHPGATRSLEEMARVQGIAWYQRERWAKQLVEGVFHLHSNGFVAGKLFSCESPVVVDATQSLLFWHFKHQLNNPRWFDPPEAHPLQSLPLSACDADCIENTSKADIFKLGAVLWLLAENSTQKSINPWCIRAGCGERQGKCNHSAHPEPTQLPPLAQSIPQYYRDMITACRAGDPNDRPPTRVLLKMFPPSHTQILNASSDISQSSANAKAVDTQRMARQELVERVPYLQHGIPSGAFKIDCSEPFVDIAKPALGISISSTFEPATECKSSKTGADLNPQKPPRWHNISHGWHVGAIASAVIATLVFISNLGLTIWAATNYGIDNGIGTLFDGSCTSTKNLSLWLHLLINALSTALLSASNFCMQCLAAPTRQEIEQAHRRYIWLNIGVPSTRNLFYISRGRALIWLFLATSSIPLHLFYNSAVFSTLSTREYDILTISPNLANGNFFNASAVPQDAVDPGPNDHSQSDRWAYQPFPRSRLIEYGSRLLIDIRNDSIWQKMEVKDCIRQYGKQFISTHGEFLAVSPALNDSYSIKFMDTAYPKMENGRGPAYNWMCDIFPEYQYGINNEQCRLDALMHDTSEWAIRSNRRDVETGGWQPDPVDFCFGLRIEENCRLQFSLTALILVIICNAVKVICMLVMVYRHDARPLVTLGDAIASFLEEPDLTTSGSGIATKIDILSGDWGQTPKKWTVERPFWLKSSSLTRWIVCNLFCIVILIITGILLSRGVRNQRLADNSLEGLWSLGYGTVTFQSLLSSDAFASRSLLLPIFVANLPQLLLSFIYLAYNDLFTCMLLGQEWSSYAHRRKPLRVTQPKGQQRSTYNLQLPYTYAIPLMMISGALHWLVSQSIFLARITVFDNLKREDRRWSVSTCGYSNIAIVTVILVSALALCFANATGFRRYPGGMPLAGSNSAAISVACHAPAEDVDASMLPVKWGAIKTGDGSLHCCFTSFEVATPESGQMYERQNLADSQSTRGDLND
ncbi:MAG: hypothetical protein Q9220_005636 [cf. Caloplaca sp. 1 TL-2023]